MPRYMISNLLGLVGATIGGVAGFYMFKWLLAQGFYGLIIPGAFLGFGCSLLARHPSQARGICCGIAAFVLSQYTDWRFTITDDSFLEFVRAGKTMTAVTILMSAIGTVVAYWLGGDSGMPGIGSQRDFANVPAEPRSRDRT